MIAYKFVQIGHYLTSFVGSILEASMLELATMREEIDLLKYCLEQTESTNSELVKETNSSEEAFREAQEMIDHWDDELRRAKKRIEDLERQRSRTGRKIKDLKRQRSEAERDCHRTRDDVEHLRRTFRVKKSQDYIPSKVYSRRSPSGSSAKGPGP